MPLPLNTVLFALPLLILRDCPPRKVDTSGVNYSTLASVAEVSASKASGATRLHQERRLRVLQHEEPSAAEAGRLF